MKEEKKQEEFWDNDFVPTNEAKIELLTEDQVYNFKIKPVWQFQSIEVEIPGTKKDIPKVMDMYAEILDGLMKIAPEQKKELTPVAPKGPKLASEPQKETMRKFDIPFTNQTTAAEAQALIQASVDKLKKQS